MNSTASKSTDRLKGQSFETYRRFFGKWVPLFIQKLAYCLDLGEEDGIALIKNRRKAGLWLAETVPNDVQPIPWAAEKAALDHISLLMRDPNRRAEAEELDAKNTLVTGYTHFYLHEMSRAVGKLFAQEMFVRVMPVS